MMIKTIVVGDLETNCYIVKNDDEVIIIDPGDEVEKIKQSVGKGKVKTILVTHFHFDHIGALENLKNYYQVKVNDFSLVKDLIVIPTPGDTKDSLTFYFPKDKVMFCGDFLFANSFGRTDLETGDNKDMLKSLNLINKYNDDIKLFPGHGDWTLLGQEKQNFESYISYLENHK